MKTQIHAISPLCHIATGTETLLCAASSTLDNVRSVLVHLMVQDADKEDDDADYGRYLLLFTLEQAVQYANDLIDTARKSNPQN